jgi:hypothetical protein
MDNMADELLKSFRDTYGDILMGNGFKQYQNAFIKVILDERLLLAVSLKKNRCPNPNLGEFDINLLMISFFADYPPFGRSKEDDWKDLIKNFGLSLDRYLRWIKKIEKRKIVFYPENFTNSCWMYKRNDMDEIDRQMKDSYSYFSQYLLEYCKIQDFKTFYELEDELKAPVGHLYEHIFMKRYAKAYKLLNFYIRNAKDALRTNMKSFSRCQNKNDKDYEEQIQQMNNYEFRMIYEIDVNYQIKEMLEQYTYDQLNKEIEKVYEDNKAAICNIFNI